MALEDDIRKLAAKGELTYLSIISTGAEFRATYSPASAFGHVQAEDADPVKALQAAMKSRRRVNEDDFG